jgi:hypothetical protein
MRRRKAWSQCNLAAVSGCPRDQLSFRASDSATATQGVLRANLPIPSSKRNVPQDHVTELAKSSLIELVGQRQVRGATEHFYRLPAATHVAYEPLPSRETSAVA